MLLRLVTNANPATTLDIVNGQAVTAYRLLKDGFSLGNDAWEHQFSGPRGTQGAAAAQGVPQNRNVALPVRVYGTTKDDLAVRHAALKSAVDELRRFGGRILFQSNNQSRRQWFRVLVCGTSDTDWSRAETKNIAQLAIAAICAPYAEGDPMDYADDFSSDTVAAGNYTFDAGSGTGTGTHAFTPKDVAGCELWLAADNILGLTDGQAVSSWADASGNGRDAVQGTGSLQPVYKTNIVNGKPVVRFDAVDDLLNAPLTNNDATRTVIAVIKGQATNFLTAWALNPTGGAAGSVISLVGGGWGYAHNQGGTITTITGSSVASFSAISARYNSTSSEDLYVNGAAAQNIDPLDAYQDGTKANFQVGGGLGGDIAEIIVFNSALSGTDLDKIRNYLGDKYNLGFGAAQPPVANVADVAVSAGALTPIVGTLALTAERRAYFSAYGYTYGDQQAQAQATPGATITGFKAGAMLKRTTAANYIECYVDDNGTNSRLRIDVILAGVRTNRATVNLGARVVNGTTFCVRGRLQGNQVTASYDVQANGGAFLGAGDTELTYTLAAGAEINTLGVNTATNVSTVGNAGFSWIPQAAGATIKNLVIAPYTYRSINTATRLYGTIPGDAPALMEAWVAALTVGTFWWGLVAPYKRPAVPASGLPTPFDLIEAESTATNVINLPVVADANASGGNLRQATMPVALPSAYWTLDLSTISPDDYSEEVCVEIWARMKLASTLTSPLVLLRAREVNGTASSKIVYTDEYGATGKTLVAPSAGTVYRRVRLGTFRLRPGGQISLGILLQAGGSGAFGIDWLTGVPIRRRAAGPTGKPADSAYPYFLSSAVAPVTKKVRSDCSGLLCPFSTAFVALPAGQISHIADSGLGGALLEAGPGDVDVNLQVADAVPDDPTATANTDTLTLQSLGVHFAITPRYSLIRPS